MKNMYAAFIKAQQGFNKLVKDSTNPFYKSKYADLAGCFEAISESLHNNGIGIVQVTHPSDHGVTVESIAKYTNDDGTSGENRTIHHGITVETILVHESGESISSGLLSVPANKQDPQGFGSALTYARRYSLMAVCGLAPEDDDGNAASKKVEMPKVYREQKPEKPKNKEDEEAKMFLWTTLVKGKYKDNPKAAGQWIKSTCGKVYADLKADDVQELLNEYDKHFGEG
jgi:hypothetical protein